MIEARDPHRHVYRPPIKPGPGVTGDVRSPCPALNTLANHGFLPRSGRNIRPHTFIHGLQSGYNISYPLAAFLTWGSFMLLGQWTKVSLGDLARHGCVEHNASLGHRDAPADAEYAPSSWDAEYVQRLLDESSDGAGLRLRDIALARVKREAEYPAPLDGVHAEIARGEMGMVLALFGRWVPKLPADVPPSPTASGPSRPLTPSHSREASSGSAYLDTSASGFSAAPTSTLSMRSSQSTLVDPSPPASPKPTKATLASAIDALRTTLAKPLAPPAKTVYTPAGTCAELELSVPLDIVHRWWTREELPCGFRTASVVIGGSEGTGYWGVGEKEQGAYALETQRQLGFPGTGEGEKVVGFLDTVRMSQGIKKAMADIRRQGI
jgi:hypothetical protein